MAKLAWKEVATHNKNTAACLKEEEMYVNETKRVPKQKWMDITEEKLDLVIRRLKSWKSLGADQIHNCWFKHLRGLYPVLYTASNHSIHHTESIPKWVRGGQRAL
eukprot:8595450-Ditylum_brightwellii.AAC.1